VEKEEKDERERDNRVGSDVDEGYETGELDFKTMHRSKQWTSKQIRKIM
jgi:hypothetical protein